uniref:Major histocompatibility complex class I-related gene protein n=1 Tax=Maylandia zebra TaxID=106582 RepID=A0A3P9D7M3_9CICH
FTIILLLAFILPATGHVASSGQYLSHYYELFFYHVATGSSGVANISEFLSEMVFDGIQAGYCDSRNKILEPRQDWAKKILDDNPQQLKSLTVQCFVTMPNLFRAWIFGLQQQFNQPAGGKVFPSVSGCEWDESTGEMINFLRYAYNGEDFLEFDMKTLRWIVLKPEAVITKQRWDTDENRIKYTVKFLSTTCPKWLKMSLESGKHSLQRTVLPSVSLLQKSSSSPVSCHATGFYPQRAVMFWRKDGEEIHDGVDPGEILPNNDETFQMCVDLNVSSVTTEDWSRYDCVFQLSDGDDIITKLDKKVIRTNCGKIIPVRGERNVLFAVSNIMLDFFVLYLIPGGTTNVERREQCDDMLQ